MNVRVNAMVMAVTILFLTMTPQSKAGSPEMKNTEEWFKAHGLPQPGALPQPKGKNVVAGVLQSIGEAPQDYGQVFHWDRKDKQINLVVYVAARDPLGVAIAGLRKGDTIHVSDASGSASFDGGRQDLVSSIIGLIGAGGKALAMGNAGGKPDAPEKNRITDQQADSLIKAGENLMKQLIKPKNKRRDAFGRDPGTGKYAKHEGGIIICLPSAGGVLYGGPSRSLKGKRARKDENVHKSVEGKAFYPVQGDVEHNTREVQKDGVAHLVAFDSRHDDNTGYYRVFLVITRGGM